MQTYYLPVNMMITKSFYVQFNRKYNNGHDHKLLCTDYEHLVYVANISLWYFARRSKVLLSQWMITVQSLVTTTPGMAGGIQSRVQSRVQSLPLPEKGESTSIPDYLSSIVRLFWKCHLLLQLPGWGSGRRDRRLLRLSLVFLRFGNVYYTDSHEVGWTNL